jgi:hypothetical protein
MFEQYIHTLIPRDGQFAPEPKQVTSFLDALSILGAVPRDATLTVMKPSGRVRWYTDPLTGAKTSFPAHDYIALESTVGLSPLIGTLSEYEVTLDGHGPPETPPFALHTNGSPFTGNYGFVLRLCVRPEPVAMSDPHGGERVERNQSAVFRHPVTGKVNEVVQAGRARFWTEFEFGKWLLPKIDESLEILNPAIVSGAQRSFELRFAQGLRLI